MKFLPFLLAIAVMACSTPPPKQVDPPAPVEVADYNSPTLSITRLTPNTFVHTSDIVIPDWGTFPCNGLVVFDDGEALVFDTPVYDSIANELLDWIENDLKCKPVGVVATHFHEDCLGGLGAFEQRKITSFAHQRTIDLARQENFNVPKAHLADSSYIPVGNSGVTIAYFGPGHTVDNVVGFFPKDSVLFGGCLIKAMGAGKGNLADADTLEWSNTVRKILDLYPTVPHVVPGHGETGGRELLEFTIEKFRVVSDSTLGAD